MNALANSQVGELEKFLQFGYPEGGEPVTFARYTGQESPDERRRILAEPPDILLTNYVMLELVLTRPDERKHAGPRRPGPAVPGPRRAAHLPRPAGRRRRDADPPAARPVRAPTTCRSSAPAPRWPATAPSPSADAVVAEVATRLFGAEVTPERVIGETLVRGHRRRDARPPTRSRPPCDAAADRARALRRRSSPTRWPPGSRRPSVWTSRPSTGRLVRRRPDHGARGRRSDLAELTGLRREQLRRRRCGAILQAGSRVTQPGHRPAAVRLPAAPVPVQGRHRLRVAWSPRTPGTSPAPTRSASPDQPGQGAAAAGVLPRVRPGVPRRRQDQPRTATTSFVPRRDADASGGDTVTGYLYVSADYPWPDDPLAAGRLPDRWLVTDPDTEQRRGPGQQEEVPARPRSTVDPTAAWTPPAQGLPAWFVSTPFAFCMRCGVSYEQVRGNDFGKLATLDAEGRSSAMTLLSASIVRSLRAVPADELARSGPQAADLRRQPAGRQPAGRPLQRLRPGHPAARRAVPRARRSRRRRARPTRTSPAAVTDGPAACRPRDFAPDPEAQVPGQGRRRAGPARRRRVPAVRRPAARLARHHAQPGADRAADGRLPRPGRDRRRRRVLGRAPTCSTRSARRSARSCAGSCSTSSAGSAPSRSTCLTEDGFDTAQEAVSQRQLDRALGDGRGRAHGRRSASRIPRPARSPAAAATCSPSPAAARSAATSTRAAAGLPGKVDDRRRRPVIDDLFDVLDRRRAADPHATARTARSTSSTPARCAGTPATGTPAPPTRCASLPGRGDAPGSTRSSATSTATSPAATPGCCAREHTAQVPQHGPRSSARTPSAPATCRCCTARRRWSSASTSPTSTPSGCATSRRPRPTTPSAPAGPAAAASRRSCSPTAPPATPTTATGSAAPARWSPARSSRPAST